jgi:hypothetical protein
VAFCEHVLLFAGDRQALTLGFLFSLLHGAAFEQFRVCFIIQMLQN